MVTHNQEFANQYSTRIINLKDGCIVSDSNLFEKKQGKSNKKAKTSMPIVTALALSF